MSICKRICLAIGVVLLSTACQQTLRDFTRDAVLEVEGEILYQDQIEAFIPSGLATSDSLYLAESFKKQWITQVLLYQKAFANVGNSQAIKQQTESYRKELVINHYQQQLIQEKLEDISEDSLQAYYQKNKDLFLLEEAVIKGMFIKIPSSATHQQELSDWLSNTTDENLENIMRYCTQHAVQYEFFLENWTPFSKITTLMPESIDPNNPSLTRGIMIQNSADYSYYLRITGMSKAGSPQPYEMVYPRLHNILLNQEKIKFINQFQQELYNQAIKNGMVKTFETN